MRNWNYLYEYAYSPWMPVSTLPMRNWNLNTKLCVWNKKNGFHFTYEELKQGRIWWILKKWGVFPLYLWGIETFHPSMPWVKGRICFHFTYEELKLSKHFIPSWNFTCFHFTYEELKHWIVAWGWRKNESFHFTYEELKLVCNIWPNKKKNLFPLYLWGIETLSKEVI